MKSNFFDTSSIEAAVLKCMRETGLSKGASQLMVALTVTSKDVAYSMVECALCAYDSLHLLEEACNCVVEEQLAEEANEIIQRCVLESSNMADATNAACKEIMYRARDLTEDFLGVPRTRKSH